MIIKTFISLTYLSLFLSTCNMNILAFDLGTMMLSGVQNTGNPWKKQAEKIRRPFSNEKWGSEAVRFRRE